MLSPREERLRDRRREKEGEEKGKGQERGEEVRVNGEGGEGMVRERGKGGGGRSPGGLGGAGGAWEGVEQERRIESIRELKILVTFSLGGRRRGKKHVRGGGVEEEREKKGEINNLPVCYHTTLHPYPIYLPQHFQRPIHYLPHSLFPLIPTPCFYDSYAPDTLKGAILMGVTDPILNVFERYGVVGIEEDKETFV